MRRGGAKEVEEVEEEDVDSDADAHLVEQVWRIAMSVNPARAFTDLIVWQKAHAFVQLVYQATKGFPKEELFCLSHQFRRAAVSIVANIAEGFRK